MFSVFFSYKDIMKSYRPLHLIGNGTINRTKKWVKLAKVKKEAVLMKWKGK